jgi:hypothetical protein
MPYTVPTEYYEGTIISTTISNASSFITSVMLKISELYHTSIETDG